MTDRSTTMIVRPGTHRRHARKFTLGQVTCIDPLPIVSEVPSLCSTNTRALDLGAGTGRNAIYLARHGVHVDAIDRFAPAIDEINDYARVNKLPIRALVHDLCQCDPEFHGYELILCTLILHLLSPSRAASLLENARIQAAPGTLHVVAAITSEGDFSSEFLPGERFYPHPDDLRRAYAHAGWQIQRAYTEKRTMRQRHADGSATHNLVSFLIARRTSL